MVHSRCVEFLYPAAVKGEDFCFQAFDGVLSFGHWNGEKLGPQPSMADIEAAWPNAKAASVMAAVRDERNRRLAATDFMAMPDYPNAPANLAAYRQALRDFPATIDPAVLSWPLDVASLNWPVL